MSCKDKKKRAVFAIEEVKLLIQFWSDSKIQRKFATSLRHAVIWEELASQMKQVGFERSWREVKSKINNLKTEYRKFKPVSGSATPDWPYFSAMHLVLGQKDIQREELVDDSLENFDEEYTEVILPINSIKEEIREVMPEVPENGFHFLDSQQTEPLPKRPRLVQFDQSDTCSRLQDVKSEFDQPGPSGLQVLSPDYSEEDASEFSGELPQEPATSNTFKKIPRPSQRMPKEVDQILNFFKSAEERQSKQLEIQNQILRSWIRQDLEAKEREDRVADALINTLNSMTANLKRNKRGDSPAFRHSSLSPPLRVPSPTPKTAVRSTQSPTHQPRIIFVQVPSPPTGSYRPPSTPTSQQSDDTDEEHD